MDDESTRRHLTEARREALEELFTAVWNNRSLVPTEVYEAMQAVNVTGQDILTYLNKEHA